MGRAGKALKQALAAHKISQNKLAVVLEVDRAVVNRWFHEQVDPNAETVAEIVKALKSISPDAAEEFIKLYLGDLMREDESLDEKR
jgi:transcriptional regulator with XRE-family HTH domain